MNDLNMFHRSMDIEDLFSDYFRLDDFKRGGSAQRYCLDKSMLLALTAEEFNQKLIEGYPTLVAYSSHRFFDKGVVSNGGGKYILQVKANNTRRDLTSCKFTIFASHEAGALKVWGDLCELFKKYEAQGNIVDIDVAIRTSSGVTYVGAQEIINETLYDEAYPTLVGGVDSFINEYLTEGAPVVILQGPPGTGKTRFIRKILERMTSMDQVLIGDEYPVVGTTGLSSNRKSDRVAALYINSDKVLESDKIFSDFLLGDYDALIIEDADRLLMPRNDGNEIMRQFLSLGDGIIRNINKKLIFSTNLPNLGEIDEALIRPGRCYGTLVTRKLEGAECKALADRILPGNTVSLAGRRASVAEVYDFVNKEKAAHLPE